MTQEHRTQETPTPASEPDELTDADLTPVVGGTEGPPTGVGDNNGRSGV
jgi:hypothetical protein